MIFLLLGIILYIYLIFVVATTRSYRYKIRKEFQKFERYMKEMGLSEKEIIEEKQKIKSYIDLININKRLKKILK